MDGDPDFDEDSPPPPKTLWQVFQSLPERHPILPLKNLLGVKQDPFVIPLTIFVGAITLCTGYTVLTTIYSTLIFWTILVLTPYVVLQTVQACVYLAYRCVYAALSLIYATLRPMAMQNFRPFSNVYNILLKPKDDKYAFDRSIMPCEGRPEFSRAMYSSDESDAEMSRAYEDVSIIPPFAPDDLTTTLRRRRRHVMFSSDESD
ncbi:uncharacterized protein LOC114575567 [Exaiptasia diaphana]|uniref:Uncharacterized protein n=1 Tax=Exaiptasia diaphana TaxID=2652724 RepID=A0A913YMW9_EXADI|nr:uncharacterized protein LOC114575567 [Exaiptasia diaphana]KXJ10937.1 hypothetical protein AC249_AIPGENE26800 [Exaiptasia diaphana]